MLALVLAAALAGVDQPIVTGADYAAACHGQDPRQKAACLSYLTAVIATADAFHTDSLRQRGEPADNGFICPTGGIEGLQAHALAAIIADPGLASRPAALGILSGVLEAYPCKAFVGPEANTPGTGDELGGLGGLGDYPDEDGLGQLGD